MQLARQTPIYLLRGEDGERLHYCGIQEGVTIV
jgi:hypothetical protein